jgi:ATP-binding cassette subfamily F protein uup
LILDEPTNDLDLPTLRVLEEALLAFPGCVMVVSHDRYFLNRVCNGILAFEGDGQIAHSMGNYDYYLEKKKQQQSRIEAKPAKIVSPVVSPGIKRPAAKMRKLNFKEKRELEGMETHISAVEAEIARVEALFLEPNFHQQYGQQTNEILTKIADDKKELARLYARWEELEQLDKAQV